MKDFSQLLEDKLDLGEYATFVPNKKEPVYNWLYYKEGFSKQLVEWLITYFQLKEGQLVLDPFCGIGTTLLACKYRGVNAIGYDVLPIAVFASRVKTHDYDIEELKQQTKELLKKKFVKIERNFPPLFYKAFSKYALEDIAFFLEELNRLEENRDFFLLALINAAIKCSYAWKDGSVIKIKKSPKPPLRVMLRRIIYRMIKDLELFEAKPAQCIVEQKDARRLDLEDSIIDAVITSPPYLNQIDYTKVYEIENYFVGYPKPALRSYIGFSEVAEFEELPQAARPYFVDMRMVLKELHRVCRQNAKLALIVGNGYVEGVIVESDLLLAEIADEVGFRVSKIFVVNKRFALEERTKKKGILRESIIIMEKI